MPKLWHNLSHTECECRVILSHAKVWWSTSPLAFYMYLGYYVSSLDFHDSFDISGVGNTKSPARNSLGTQARCQHVDGKIQMWSKITAY